MLRRPQTGPSRPFPRSATPVQLHLGSSTGQLAAGRLCSRFISAPRCSGALGVKGGLSCRLCPTRSDGRLCSRSRQGRRGSRPCNRRSNSIRNCPLPRSIGPLGNRRPIDRGGLDGWLGRRHGAAGHRAWEARRVGAPRLRQYPGKRRRRWGRNRRRRAWSSSRPRQSRPLGSIARRRCRIRSRRRTQNNHPRRKAAPLLAGGRAVPGARAVNAPHGRIEGRASDERCRQQQAGRLTCRRKPCPQGCRVHQSHLPITANAAQ